MCAARLKAARRTFYQSYLIILSSPEFKRFVARINPADKICKTFGINVAVFFARVKQNAVKPCKVGAHVVAQAVNKSQYIVIVFKVCNPQPVLFYNSAVHFQNISVGGRVGEVRMFAFVHGIRLFLDVFCIGYVLKKFSDIFG